MKKHFSFRSRVSVMMLVLFAAVFALSASRSGDARLWLLTAAVPAVMVLLMAVPSRILFLDRPSLSAALVLSGFGIMAGVFIATDTVLSRALYCAGGLFFLLAGIVLVRSFRASLPAASVVAVIAVGIISCPLWINGPFSLTAGGLALMIVAVAAFLSLRMYLPALACAGCGLLFLMLQQEVSASVVLGLISVLLFWASSGSGLWTGISFITVGGLFAGYAALFSPFSGDQSGLLSSPLSAMQFLAPEVPAEGAPVSDSLLVLLGEHFGLGFLLCALLLLCVILVRGASLALGARKSFHASLALGTVLFFGLRALACILSAAGILPLAADEFVFLSDSPQDLFAVLFLLGVLSGISTRNEAELEEDARLSMLAR